MKQYLIKSTLILIAIMCTSISAIAREHSNSVKKKEQAPSNLAISLTLAQTITSRDLKKGDLIEFYVPHNINFETGTIPAGAKAFAEVVKIKKRKSWGRAGIIGLNMLYLQVNESRIKLQAPLIEKAGISHKDKANLWFWCMIFTIPLNCIPPLFIKGEEATLHAGFTTVAYTVN